LTATQTKGKEAEEVNTEAEDDEPVATNYPGRHGSSIFLTPGQKAEYGYTAQECDGTGAQ
jgi:hypothetical protein